MFVFAVFGLLTGGWLIDSAVHKRNPITSALDIIRDPGNARTIVANADGQSYNVEHTTYGPTSPDNTNGSGSVNASSADNGYGTSGGASQGGNTAADQALAFARAQIGDPYRWGATGPDSWDCSGLVMKAYESAGVKLPRTTATMHAAAVAGRGLKLVNRRELQKGDLIFPDAGHVQIYTGVKNAAGKEIVVEAPRAGLKVREVAAWGFLYAARPNRVTAPNSTK